MERPILSVVIVNYNVRYFLEHTLQSLQRAATRFEKKWAHKPEIFVVDNHSVDGSVAMVKNKFPGVNLIANKENKGFAVANNQAMKRVSGKYVLLLNPDTVVEEDTLVKTVGFMEDHSDAGGLGVKMIDGQGHFLPESKRSFPSPAVAFYKLFGLSKLFPHSKIFGRYHLGHLDEDETHEVEVLAGAFMLLRKKVLDEIGLFDEDFFMYGEDIDLSYRIVKAGYKNYYYPDTRIIHYKGESTKKGSLNYVRMFYKAMSIFAKKHLSSAQAGLFQFLIQLAIFLRATFTGINTIIRKIALPVVDAGLLYGGMYLLKRYWEANYRYVEGGSYPEEFMMYSVPGYILIWLLTVFFSGGYDRPVKLPKIVRGLVGGTIAIAVIYAFLPEHWRFSRALILMGAAWSVFAMVGYRVLFHFLRTGKVSFDQVRGKRIVIVGNEQEVERVRNLLTQARISFDYIGFVSPDQVEQGSKDYLGALQQLPDITNIYQIDELIFCAKDVGATQIISSMAQVGTKVAYKIIPEDSLGIIGSSSAHAPGELYAIDINLAILTSTNRRNKRLLDLVTALGGLILYPLTCWFYRNKRQLFQNLWQVFIGQRAWVGYAPVAGNPHPTIDTKLPEVRPGVFSPIDELKYRPEDKQTISRLNLLYAKDYTVWHDLEIIFKNFFRLDRKQTAEA